MGEASSYAVGHLEEWIATAERTPTWAGLECTRHICLRPTASLREFQVDSLTVRGGDHNLLVASHVLRLMFV